MWSWAEEVAAWVIAMALVIGVFTAFYYPYQPRQVRCAVVESWNSRGGSKGTAVLRILNASDDYVEVDVPFYMQRGDTAMLAQWWSGHWTMSETGLGCGGGR